jgi:class 3 adenylate cyclase
MFADFVDFTITSEKLSPEVLVAEIHTCFSAFDNILQKYKVEKIKTIGDAYLCAGGIPVADPGHATQVVLAALEMQDFIRQRKKEKEARNEIPFELRIGIHSGPVVSGIVGIKKYAYDIWGDTVNIAARMEQNSLPGKINISSTTWKLVKDKFQCTYRGKIEAKNKGEIDMYFLEV